MKSGVLLSVREKATRLPGKVLLPLGNCNVTEGLIRRLRGSAEAEAVVVATSHDARDDVLCRIAEAEGVACFRGSEDDKLVRYRDAARAHGFDFMVVVDGDDPFVSVTHIDRMIVHARSDPADYLIWNGLPLGATGFGLRLAGLERVCDTKTDTETEVWARLFTADPSIECREIEETDPLYRQPDIRMTLDYAEDHRFFCAVADGLAADGRETSFENVMRYLAAHPEITEINRGVQEAYAAHLAKSRSQTASR